MNSIKYSLKNACYYLGHTVNKFEEIDPARPLSDDDRASFSVEFLHASMWIVYMMRICLKWARLRLNVPLMNVILETNNKSRWWLLVNNRSRSRRIGVYAHDWALHGRFRRYDSAMPWSKTSFTEPTRITSRLDRDSVPDHEDRWHRSSTNRLVLCEHKLHRK